MKEKAKMITKIAVESITLILDIKEADYLHRLLGKQYDDISNNIYTGLDQILIEGKEEYSS